MGHVSDKNVVKEQCLTVKETAGLKKQLVTEETTKTNKDAVCEWLSENSLQWAKVVILGGSHLF